MRLIPVLPTVAGLLLAWAVTAQADAPPPAAPIFYCPTPGKATPATPAKAPVKPVVAPIARPSVVHASVPHAQGCPTMRVAAGHARWRSAERHFAVAPPPAAHVRRYAETHHHADGQRHVADGDVSAAQAFIYRYERAAHGLNAGAAQQAWAEGRRGAAMGGQYMAQRQTPPCPHGCPGPEAWRHAGPGPGMMAQGAPRASAPPIPNQPGPGPQSRAYAWQDAHGGGGYSIQRTERAGGWSYAERNGQGQYRQWGDHFAGEPGHGWGEDAARRGPCPHACGGPRGQAEAYETAGRDAAGFLTWPGKTPGW